MKNKFLCAILLVALQVFSQENNSSKGNYFANFYFGNATIESETSYKVNADALGGSVGKEFILSKPLSLITAVELLRIQYEIPAASTSSPLFQVNNFIKIPVLLRYGHEFAAKARLYAETGIYIASLYGVKIENSALNSCQKESNVGYNFGLQLNMGLRYQLSDIYSFEFGLSSQGDIFQVYDDTFSNLKIAELYSFQLKIVSKL